VDFACLEAKLIIEVDGSQYFDAAGDVARTQWLHEQGFRVLRFWNNDVLVRTHQVFTVVHEALDAAGPHPDLPPQAGEGEKP
jgi:adenine-specific DNA-methyltransferase